MKQKQLLRTLLAAVCLLVGTNAWAETYLTTMTGQLGLADNSAGWWTYYSKAATIKKGETYTYTFTNYDLQNINDETGSWILEVRDNSTGYCFDARGNSDKAADNAGWKWDGNPTTNTLTYDYTGKVWSDLYANASGFKTAYNEVVVTLTITRSADGGTVTVARSATLSDSNDFSGTWTCSGFSDSDDMTIKLASLYAHQNITKVRYTNASGEVTNYELKNVDLSAFTGDYCSYDAGVETFSVSSATQKWCTLDLSSYYTSIPGSITNVNMTLTENIEGVVETVTRTNRFGIGVYGNTRSSFGKPSNVDTGNSITWWGITGNSAANRIYYNNSSYVNNGLTLNKDAKVVVLMDMINKKFSYIQDGTTKVDNQNFNDNNITQAKYLAVQTWSTPVAASMKDVTLEIVYVETTYYTATFTNTTSGNAVSATIYSDAEKETPVTNGMLENGHTYYYTATEEGYQDYEGSFTVTGSNPAESFAMIEKTVCNFSAKAVDSNDGTLQENIATGTSYAGESNSFYIPACVLVDGTLHFTTSEDYKKTETVNSVDQVFPYAYTEKTVDNVAYFYEGESLSVHGSYGSSSTGDITKESKGSSRRPLANSYLYTPALAGGIYTVYMHVFGNNAKSESLALYYCDPDGENPVSLGVNTEKSSAGNYSTVNTTNLVIPEGKSLCFYKNSDGNSNFVIDYIYLVRMAGLTKTISAAGWATYCSPYALDLANATGLTDAYIVTGGQNGVLTKSSVKGGTVPANTGLLLKGNEGTATIPVVASSKTNVENNILKGVTEATVIDAETGWVLMNDDTDGLGFYQNAVAFTVGANTAYILVSALPVPPATARASYLLFDDMTGISQVAGSKVKTNGVIYNLNGQRVSNPTKGIYIIDGVKVAIE